MIIRGEAEDGTDVNVPNALINVVRSWTRTNLICVRTHCFIPGLSLQVPNASGEKASSDEIQKAGRSDEEVLELCRSSSPAYG